MAKMGAKVKREYVYPWELEDGKLQTILISISSLTSELLQDL
jgi:hypothetical protein